MALTLEANYSKKIGLPGYSSHQYSLTLKTELSDISQAETESARLHQTLQASVDRELQKVGFLPTNGNGHQPSPANGNGKLRELLGELNDLGGLLKQADKDKRSTEKEVASVRQTIRSLQGLKI